MATGTAVRAYHSTLSASTVDVVTMTSVSPTVRVDNRGSTDLFVTTNGSAPTVAGAETWVVPANQSRIFDTGLRAQPGRSWTDEAGNSEGTTAVTSFVVKLISSGTPTYSVTGL